MMPRKALSSAVLACVALALAALPAAAGDAKASKEKSAASGVWGKKGDELKIEFADKDVLKIFPHGDSVAFVIVCSYTTTKEGQVKVKIKDLEGSEEVKEKAKSHVPVGLKFRFTWKTRGDTATLSDVKGENVEAFKSHLEGDYEKK
jgi:hypothetical protein